VSLKRLFWVSHRYVFPVLAETPEEAISVGFTNRALVAEECGPNTEAVVLPNRPGDKDGWAECKPYNDDGRTVAEIADAPSERAALLLLDKSMRHYGVSRDDVAPLVAMKLAVVLDDTREPDDRLEPVIEAPGDRLEPIGPEPEA